MESRIKFIVDFTVGYLLEGTSQDDITKILVERKIDNSIIKQIFPLIDAVSVMLKNLLSPEEIQGRLFGRGDFVALFAQAVIDRLAPVYAIKSHQALANILLQLTTTNSVELSKTVSNLSAPYNRSDMLLALGQILSKYKFYTAYVFSVMLGRAGDRSAIVSFTLAACGLMYDGLNEEAMGMSGLEIATNSLDTAQRALFYDEIVSPVATHMFERLPASDHGRLLRLADIIKAASPHLRYKKVQFISLEVASACNFDCVDCAHGVMRLESKKFQLSLEQVKKFIEFTEKSNYQIKTIFLSGPGEPFLWKHFNEGLALLHQSENILSIHVVTNGKFFHRIADETWDLIDSVYVSVYEDAQDLRLKDSLSHHQSKLEAHRMLSFKRLLQPADVPLPMPHACSCHGPMVFDGRVFLHCGPVVFDAARLYGKDIYEMKELYVDLEENYLSEYDPLKIGNMEICRYCWGNTTYNASVEQSIDGGNWQ